MRNLESRDKLDKKRKGLRMSQTLSGFSDRIKNVFNKPPEKIEAFGREWRLDKCESPDRVQEITEGEKKYLKITVKPGDKKEWKRKALERGTERAEIQQNTLIDYDKEYIQDFSFQIPKDFALCPRRTVIRQWKRRPQITGDDAPLLSHRIKKIDGKYYLVLTDGNRDEIGKRIPMEGNEGIIGKDVRIESKIKFSDNGESMVSVVMNCEGKETIIYEEGPINIFHPKEIKSGTKAYFKFGLYRDCYKYAIRKIKKDKTLKPEEKKIQIGEIKKVKEMERTEDSHIILKKYDIKESEK